VFFIYLQAHSLPVGIYIDDAWLFANTWLNGSSQSLGVQTFFSYGPLAPWLGIALPGVPSFFPGGFLIQAFFFAGLVYVFFNFATRIRRHPATLRRIYYFLISASLFWADLQRTDENFYQLWLIGHVTLFYSESSSRIRKLLLISWTLGGALLLNYKGSIGFACLFLLFIAWLFNALNSKSLRSAYGYFLLYALTFEGCFMATSGHWSCLSYLSILSKLTSSYSETYSLSPTHDSYYLWGILFIFAAFFSAWNYIHLQQDSSKRRNIFFLLSVFFWLYFEYKHGFVRADFLHIDRFYKDTLTILLIWSLGAQTYKIRELFLSRLSLLLALVCLISTQQLLGDSPLTSLFKSRIREAQTFTFNIFPSNHTKPQNIAYDRFLPSLFHDLFSFMHRQAASSPVSQHPTLSFISDKVLLLKYLPEFETRLMPSTLQYIAADCPSLQRKNQTFLSAPSRPDYLLLDSLTLDSRSPMFDLSHVLAPILEHYERIAYLNGFTVLKRKRNTPENAETILPLLSTPPPPWGLRLTQSALKFIFKTPTLMIRSAFIDTKTKDIYVETHCVTLADFRNGVFLGPTSLLQNFPPPPGPSQNPVSVLKVQTYWDGDGSWFLKPWKHLPIEIRYLDPRAPSIKL
jgi:hypothetical protein